MKHCRQGHAIDGPNAYRKVSGDGRVSTGCRQCRTNADRARYIKKTALPENCQRCGGPITGHRANAATPRIYCSIACRDRAFEHNVPPVHCPHAQLAIPESARRVSTWAGVPERCSWCGGMWRKVTAGVCCYSCGRNLFVVADLGKVGHVDNDDVPGIVPMPAGA